MNGPPMQPVQTGTHYAQTTTETVTKPQAIQTPPDTVQGQGMSRAAGYAPNPYPDVPMRAALAPPQPGQKLLGYELLAPETGCCKCSDLTPAGMFLLILLIICFSCLAFIPCCVESFHRKTQRPVYG